MIRSFKILSIMNPGAGACCFLMLLCLLSFRSQAQVLVPLEVSQNKSVHLFFTSNVKYCDTGSQDVLYTINGNILKLTAAKENFPETNLTIITEDDYLYNYLLIYNKDPRRLNLQPDPKTGKQLKVKPTTGLTASVATVPAAHVVPATQAAPVTKAAPVTQAAPAQAAPVAATTPAAAATKEATPAAAKPIPDAPAISAPPVAAVKRSVAEHSAVCKKIIGNWKFNQFSEYNRNAGLELRNIYVDEHFIYFTLYTENATDKDVLIDYVNFQQGDRVGVMQRVYREELKKPVFVYNKQDKLRAKGQQYMVYVFEKFTIDADKKLLIELGEKEGKRFFSMPISAKHINEAESLDKKPAPQGQDSK